MRAVRERNAVFSRDGGGVAKVTDFARFLGVAASVMLGMAGLKQSADEDR